MQQNVLGAPRPPSQAPNPARPHLPRSVLRALLTLGLTLAALLLPALPASAHADLLSATPAAGTVVPVRPQQITLHFSERVTLRLSSIKVIGPDGRRVETGPAHATGSDGTTLAVPLSPGARPGTFVVDWLVTAEDDGHATSGAVVFSVGGSAPPTKTATYTPRNRLTNATLDLATWLGLAGLALLLGTTAFRRLCLPTPGHPDRAPAPPHTRTPDHSGCTLTAQPLAPGLTPSLLPLHRAAAVGWAAALLGALLQLFLHGPATQGLSLAHLTDRSPLAATLATHEGHTLAVRILLLAVVAACGEPLLRHSWGLLPTGLLALALAGTWSATSHASNTPALVATTLHVTAMALWAGGLYGTLALLRHHPLAAATATPRFSLLALGAVTTLAVTGLYQAFREVGAPADLADTPYGRLLLLKTALFVLLLAAAAAGANRARRRSVDALRRAVLLELLGVTAVLITTVLLIGTAPATTPAPSPGAARTVPHSQGP
ncbi:copper resistance protein CopC [Kitasatospora sp. MMS16-BH015]|uniref:copper resistance CopC/CopD family protein n=1 Tax=Kitasatospora sp. MMS16-BH015 TaxID=2018025 RepID=UPI00131A5789|nr:copper resistance protein CopC [Kitasatospora sp. MMS16-BH015]